MADYYEHVARLWAGHSGSDDLKFTDHKIHAVRSSHGSGTSTWCGEFIPSWLPTTLLYLTTEQRLRRPVWLCRKCNGRWISAWWTKHGKEWGMSEAPKDVQVVPQRDVIELCEAILEREHVWEIVNVNRVEEAGQPVVIRCGTLQITHYSYGLEFQRECGERMWTSTHDWSIEVSAKYAPSKLCLAMVIMAERMAERDAFADHEQIDQEPWIDAARTEM